MGYNIEGYNIVVFFIKGYNIEEYIVVGHNIEGFTIVVFIEGYTIGGIASWGKHRGFSRDGGTGDAADAVASPILRVGMLASPIFSLTFA